MFSEISIARHVIERIMDKILLALKHYIHLNGVRFTNVLSIEERRVVPVKFIFDDYYRKTSKLTLSMGVTPIQLSKYMVAVILQLITLQKYSNGLLILVRIVFL